MCAWQGLGSPACTTFWQLEAIGDRDKEALFHRRYGLTAPRVPIVRVRVRITLARALNDRGTGTDHIVGVLMIWEGYRVRS